MRLPLKTLLAFTALTGGLNHPATAAPKLGMGPGVTGGSSSQKMVEYETWLNRRVDYLIQFIHFSRFTGSDPSLTGTNWSFNGVNNLPPEMKSRAVIAVGMLPNTEEGSTTL